MLKADLYDPLSGQSHVNPYPIYAHLRDEAPVYFSNSREVWALSRYDDVQAALRDWATFSSASGVEMADYVGFFGAGNFLEMDPPAHDILSTNWHRLSQFSKSFGSSNLTGSSDLRGVGAPGGDRTGAP